MEWQEAVPEVGRVDVHRFALAGRLLLAPGCAARLGLGLFPARCSSCLGKVGREVELGEEEEVGEAVG